MCYKSTMYDISRMSKVITRSESASKFPPNYVSPLYVHYVLYMFVVNQGLFSVLYCYRARCGGREVCVGKHVILCSRDV